LSQDTVLPLFGCSGIHLTLGGREILGDIDLDAHPGRVLGIVGPNGAGKTSLFEVLSGRIRPSHGRVHFDGHDITSLSIQRRARLGIGRTFQSPVVSNALSVAQVLEAARKAFRPKLSVHQAEWACEVVNLSIPGATRAGALDTLHRRKLLLACLMMRRPRVLLLDEPASGMIHAEVEELDQIVRVLAREMKIALLVVEHRLELLHAIADEIIALDLGRCIAAGTPDAVFNHPDVRAAYFEGAAA
ncbi:MAG: ABC transporter ATP-binding protein, partial [Gammaproteobacteria bacterium]